jgi:hypothetical protein
MHRPRFYSPFWLAGGVLTSPEWAARDAAEEPADAAEALEMGAWLRLGECERAAIVEGYAARRPKLSRMVV